MKERERGMGVERGRESMGKGCVMAGGGWRPLTICRPIYVQVVDHVR